MIFSPLFSLTLPARNTIVEALNGNYDAWNAIMHDRNAVLQGPDGIPNFNSRGIYIWGYKVAIIGHGYFLPLYVGKHEADCIGRIIEHLNPNNVEGIFGVKSLFKVPDTLTQIVQLYTCIHNYNDFLIGAQEANPSRADHIQNRMRNFLAAADNDWLLYFQNRAFYQQTFPLCESHNYHSIHNIAQAPAITNLTIPFCEHTTQIVNAMNQARAHLANNFCFSFAGIANDYPIDLGKCENEIKSRLAMRGLWTFSRPTIANPQINNDINVDLVNIEAALPIMQ